MSQAWEGMRILGGTKLKRAEYVTIMGRNAEIGRKRKYRYLEYVTRMRHSAKIGRRKMK
jgi:hypothetical protein